MGEHRMLRRATWEPQVAHDEPRGPSAEVEALRARVAELERRSAADEVRRQVFEYAGDAMVVHDDEGRFVEANPQACRLLGYSRDQMLSMSLPDLEPDFDLFGIKRHWAQMRRGEGVTVGGRPRHRDGTELQVEVRLSLIDDAPGRRRFLVAIRDLRDREVTRAQLAESQARFRQLVENAGDAFLLHDTSGHIVDVNRRATELLGWDRDALLSMNVVDLDAGAMPDAQRARWADTPAGSVHKTETDLCCADGTRVPVELSAAAVEWEGQSLFIAFAHDISDRRRADEERQRSIRDLARSNEELQQFASIASHDLQEPLRKVCSFADLLIEDHGVGLNEEGRRFLEIIAGAAQRMQALVRDLLAWTRVGARADLVDEVSLDAVLADVVSDLSMRIAETGAQLDIGGIGTVRADPVQMRQLLQNLVGNALKYRHPERAPAIQVHGRTVAWDPATRGPICILRVEDNGIGFGPDDARRIFEPFRRLHRRAEYAGTGIGLAICQRIVERHGGSIGAEGRVGEGAIFEVRLPLVPVARATGGLPQVSLGK